MAHIVINWEYIEHLSWIFCRQS